MSYPAPSNVGWYAVARTSTGRTVFADGPHSPAEAHRRVDTVVRPWTRKHDAFLQVGVARVTIPPEQTLPEHHQGRTP